MPAKLTVTSGPLRGEEYWIEQHVLRIGSDPECEVLLSIAGLPPLVAILEFSAGGYVVHNRWERNLVLGRTPLPPRQSLSWAPGTMLWISDLLGLTLVIEGSPVPTRRPAAVPDIPPEIVAEGGATAGDAQRDTTSKSSSQFQDSWWKIAVIVLCALALPWLYLGDSMLSANGAKQNPRFAFEDVVDRCKHDPKLKTAIQKAWEYSIRGDEEKADNIYRGILEVLLRRSKENRLSEAEEDLRQYVRDRRSDRYTAPK